MYNFFKGLEIPEGYKNEVTVSLISIVFEKLNQKLLSSSKT